MSGKKPMSPLGIANMLAQVAHNKQQRGTANNFPNAQKNSDEATVENNSASKDTISGNRKSKQQVEAMHAKSKNPVSTPKPSKNKSKKLPEMDPDAGDENYPRGQE